MAKFDILELNYITDGECQNTFNIMYSYTDDGNIKTKVKPSELSQVTTATFFGNKDDVEIMSELFGANRESFYDITNKMIVHNLYDASKIQFKSTSKKYAVGNIKTSDNIDLILPAISTDFIHICQFKDYAYGLTYETNDAPTILSVLFDDEFYLQYKFKLANEKQNTYLYFRPNDLADSSYQTYEQAIKNSGTLSNNVISTIFGIKRSLKGIERSYLVEIPEKTQNQYEKGYLIADQCVTKNHFDYKYDIDISSTDFTLNNCRQYCGIDVCGNQLYMKYRDNVSYSSRAKTTITYWPNMHSTVDPQIDEYSMVKTQPDDSYSYQHVEVVNDINRWDSQVFAGHKSSMFSLKLVDTGLNTNTQIPESIKGKLRKNIENNIRVLLENVIPANTQLFNIYFDGQ